MSGSTTPGPHRTHWRAAPTGLPEPLAEGEAEVRAADEEARRVAQTEFSRPIVLEAGAGTGKTTTLVARVVAWAIGPGWERVVASPDAGLQADGATPDERAEHVAARVLSRIAAITFTDAAAAEMAERVGRALTALGRGETPRGLLPQVIPADGDLCRRRARALVGALDHLVVRTIHAWCRRLLARAPLEARIHPRFEVDADEEAQAAVAREVVEATLRESFAGGLGEGLVHLAELGRGPDQLEAVLLALLGEGVPSGALARSPWSPERVRAAARRLEAPLEELVRAEAGAFAGASGHLVHRRILDAVQATLATLQAMSRYDLDEAAALKQTVCDAWADNLVTRLGEWSRGQFIRSEQKALGERSRAVQAAAARAAIPVAHWRRLDPEGFERAREVVAPLLERARQELRRRGILTFADLLRGARDLLRERPAVLRSTRRELDLLLVDELQDTDPVQCEIVSMLALEGPTEERPSLFLVGDPKQSIYGWRSADLRAYDALVGKVCSTDAGADDGGHGKGAGGRLHRLSVNFRSAPPVLDEVERVVAPVMRHRPGVQPGFQPLLPSAEHRGSAGFDAGGFAPVEHWVSWGWDESGSVDPDHDVGRAAEGEAQALAADVARLHDEHGVAWSDVGVLLRSTTDLEVYLQALRDARVPYAVERDRSYFQRREVIEAAAAVRCVLDPNDMLALLTLLRSPAVGVPDVALIPLWSAGLPGALRELQGPDSAALEAIRDTVQAVVRRLPAVPGLDRLAGWEWSLLAAVESLALLRSEFELGASDRFVERLRQLLLLEVSEAGRYLGRYRAGNLERFFRELSSALAGGGDPNALLRHLRGSVAERRDAEEGRPQDEEADAVHVMTIHKAKGLDFAHVYLPQLHKRRPTSNASPVVVGEVDGSLELQLFGAPTPGFDAVERERAAVEAAEGVRSLYVAITRAKQRVVMMGRWKADPEPVDPGDAQSMLDLLASRRELPPSLGPLVSALADPASTPWRDQGGARWRLATPGTARRAPRSTPGADGLADADRIAAHSRAVLERRRLAQQRMLRPRAVRASGLEDESARLAHERRADGLAATDASGREGAERSWPGAAPAREASQIAGTVVHQILETWDLEADPELELARQRTRVERLVAAAAAGDLRAPAAERVGELLDALEGGTLLRTLAALGPRVVARELPVLRSPDAAAVGTGAVAYETGTLDLVYTDEAGEPVVADYKTDRVEPDQCRQKAEHYRAQGAFYARALADALSLDRLPRVELWFLDAGRIEPLEPAGEGDRG